MYADKTLTCQDCGTQFVFTERDQAFFAERGFSEPKRCRTCAKTRRQALRQDYETVCAACGAQTKVPFQPKLDPVTGQPVKPVYCRACFDARNAGGAGAQQPPSDNVAAFPSADQPAPEDDMAAAA